PPSSSTQRRGRPGRSFRVAVSASSCGTLSMLRRKRMTAHGGSRSMISRSQASSEGPEMPTPNRRDGSLTDSPITDHQSQILLQPVLQSREKRERGDRSQVVDVGLTELLPHELFSDATVET